MRFSKNAYLQRVVTGCGEDIVGHVVGLALQASAWWVVTPIGLLRALFKVRSEQSPMQYTDWVLADWHQRYSGERGFLQYIYDGKRHDLPQIVILDNTTQSRPPKDFHFILNTAPFSLDASVRALTEKAFQSRLKFTKNYTNEENLRLCGIRNGNELVMQRVRYEDYLRTNLVLDAKIGDQQESLREKVHPEKRLEPLDTSFLANNLGVNGLIFTADGALILQKRSRRVAFRRGEYCSSASGTFSTCDVPTRLVMNECPLFREAFEELGIGTSDIAKGSFGFLGITRELIRGGQPEFFFHAETVLSYEEVLKNWKVARDKKESARLERFSFGTKLAALPLDDPTKVIQFHRRFDVFLDRYGGNASIPLLTNLALWQRKRLFGATYCAPSKG